MSTRKNHRRRWLWIGSGLLLLALLAWSLAPKPIPADFASVTRGPMQVTLDHEGKTRVHDRFEITAPFDGRVGRIDLEPGDPVVAGQTTLATLWPNASALLDPRSHAQAEAEVSTARAQLDAAVAERERARSQRDLARREHERIRGLAASGIVSELEADQVEIQATAAREAAEAAEARVDAARYAVQAAEARLRAGTDGEETGAGIALRSPIDGVVLRRLRQSAASVRPGEPLLEVGAPDDLEVVADYLSSDAVRMRPGMPAELTQWGGERSLAGVVRRVEPAGFLKISALGVEEQRVNVVLDFSDPREAWKALGDGYRVEVAVVVWETPDAVKVPTNGLFRHEGDWATFVVRDGRAELRPLVLGQRNQLEAQVIEGLEEGETVLAHPSDAIEDGSRVAPRED